MIELNEWKSDKWEEAVFKVMATFRQKYGVSYTSGVVLGGHDMKPAAINHEWPEFLISWEKGSMLDYCIRVQSPAPKGYDHLVPVRAVVWFNHDQVTYLAAFEYMDELYQELISIERSNRCPEQYAQDVERSIQKNVPHLVTTNV
jgi:hypothetical protein